MHSATLVIFLVDWSFIQTVWACNLCKKKHEILAKTGQWYHGGMAKPVELDVPATTPTTPTKTEGSPEKKPKITEQQQQQSDGGQSSEKENMGQQQTTQAARGESKHAGPVTRTGSLLGKELKRQYSVTDVHAQKSASDTHDRPAPDRQQQHADNRSAGNHRRDNRGEGYEQTSHRDSRDQRDQREPYSDHQRITSPRERDRSRDRRGDADPRIREGGVGGGRHSRDPSSDRFVDPREERMRDRRPTRDRDGSSMRDPSRDRYGSREELTSTSRRRDPSQDRVSVRYVMSQLTFGICLIKWSMFF